ncbi:hypothetical protein K461DRAFT_4711 [Myriangium duriaei CBS 260.36]|uniref:Uncharacterized protein n=1 Tax=Myriangium duriaei CBS 260.36 TaxID=1168546 RepID=A0A9P4JA04_9PEZI|nr:hypothetical protein K461DRAFT_4711 [Myriangium duriaei CBS 260.36]
MPHNDEGSSSGEDFWRRILNDTSSYPLSDTHSLHQSNMSTSDTDQNGIIEHSTGSPQQPAMASLEAAVSEVRGFQTAAQALPNGDITTHDDFEVIAQLDVPIIEDVPAELEEFVRLTKHRVPGEAMLFFNDVLVRHMRHFPVIAELADFLLEDGCYSKLETVSGGVLAEWERDPTANSSEVTVEEKALLRLYHAYARIKTKGLLNEAVDLTKALHNSIPSGGEQPSDVQVSQHLVLVSSAYHLT